MSAQPDRVHEFLTMQSRGLIALPRSIRQRYHLDAPGAQVELVEREDGVLELRPQLAVPVGQAWFWGKSWQEREREVDALVAAGQTTTHDDAAALLDHLDEIPEA